MKVQVFDQPFFDIFKFAVSAPLFTRCFDALSFPVLNFFSIRPKDCCSLWIPVNKLPLSDDLNKATLRVVRLSGWMYLAMV
jgi:hypothetical protein